MQIIKKVNKDKWIGIKVRELPKYNYKAIWNNLTTIRPYMGEVMELPANNCEFYDVSIGTMCNAGCNFCFTEDTRISTSEGEKAIKDILIGDTVFSFNDKTNNIEMNKVEQLHQRPYKGELIEIETEEGDIIRCTPNHKIFVNDCEYKEARNLQIYDTLFSI